MIERMPFVLALLGTLVPGAQAVTIFNTSLVAPGFYNGSGNPNTNFAVDTEGNLELGLSVITRHVGPINPGPNSNVYAVLPSAGPLATWNFEFSVNTQAGGGTTLLNAYIYLLTIQDITAATTSIDGDPVRLIPDNSGFGGSGKTPGVNVTTEWGAQNSENLGFPLFFPGFNPALLDLYKITLSATDFSSTPVGSISVFAQVVPEPGSIALAGMGMIGLCLATRKRRARRT